MAMEAGGAMVGICFSTKETVRNRWKGDRRRGDCGDAQVAIGRRKERDGGPGGKAHVAQGERWSGLGCGLGAQVSFGGEQAVAFKEVCRLTVEGARCSLEGRGGESATFPVTLGRAKVLPSRRTEDPF